MILNVGVTRAAMITALYRIERSGKDDNLPVHSTTREVSQIYEISVILTANSNDLF
jgi:hypothetical protein